MKIKTEQFKFDLGEIAKKIQEHTKEVFQHLLDTGKTLEGITIINDDDRKLVIIKLLPDLSLLVKEYDDIDEDDAFEMSIESIDAYELLSLLDYIRFNITKE